MIENISKEERKQILSDSISGCLFGGAIGDALGYPVEFMSYRQIINKYGKPGITELAVGKRGKAEISDDTQMTLFTANGLLFAQTQARLNGVSKPLGVHLLNAYREWYKTQTEPQMFYNDDQPHTCWIHNIAALHSSRAPGTTCMSALAASFNQSAYSRAANNSKGCGGVMRIAPVGCFGAAGHLTDETASAKYAAEFAALTHGNPLGYIPAAFTGCMIHKIIVNKINGNSVDLYDITADTLQVTRELYGDNQYYPAFEDIINRAVALSKQHIDDVDAISRLGQGWVAEEALAVALYAALKYRDNFKNALICAVNHDGDSDSTGAIAGNILGAYVGLYGVAAQDTNIITKPEVYDVIFELAQDLTDGCPMRKDGPHRDVKWALKYLYCNYGRI